MARQSSDRSRRLAAISRQACIGCEQCVAVCPVAAITMDADSIAVINADLCTGCGLCEETCPNVFKLDDDEGVAKAITPNPEGGDLDCAKQAAEECPVEAISVT